MGRLGSPLHVCDCERHSLSKYHRVAPDATRRTPAEITVSARSAQLHYQSLPQRLQRSGIAVILGPSGAYNTSSLVETFITGMPFRS